MGFFIWIFLFGYFFLYLLNMKKYTLILAFGAIVALTACGSGSTTTESTDSTAAVVDTTKTATNDTTVNGGVVTDNQETTVDGKPQHSLEQVK